MPGAPATVELVRQDTRAADITFLVFVRGRNVGSERVQLTATADGWRITASNSLSAPLNVTLRHGEIEYDASWHPRRLEVDASENNEAYSVKTSFASGQAVNEVVEKNRLTSKTDTVAPDTVVLPTNFFGAYEAMAARLSTITVGGELKVYLPSQAETRLTLTASQPERIQTPGRLLQIARHFVSIDNAGGDVPLEIWVDEAQRLARLSAPGLGVDVVREDLATVASRRQTFWRDGDTDVRVPSNGFSLAATVSKPADVPDTRRLPAIVLVPGAGTVDRDATVFGVPIFGQLAAQLADRGYLVLRYDKRGIGQSGGRTESVTMTDYADDARAAAVFLAERRDVDKKRVFLVGHSEGAAIALVAARRAGKQVAGVVLVAGFGSTGADLVLEQQQRGLSRMNLSDADRQAKIDLQKRIHDAVLTNSGWDALPQDVRRAADNAWFRSFLAFDPAKVLPSVKQPLLVLHGELDRQVVISQGERLAALANARKDARATELVRLASVNHLLTMAVTGEVDEYPKLADKQVSADVSAAIARWTASLAGPPARPTAP